MPRKPKRPCSHQGCPNLTDNRYCVEHKKQENKRYEKYDRNPVIHRRYGKVWKRIRDSYIRGNPLCEECSKAERYTRASEVHHKIPLSQGGTHDRDNLMSLCKSCHSKIHSDRWNR
ncbi:MAG: HNH endonuclease [Lachnospirales bacterium]